MEAEEGPKLVKYMFTKPEEKMKCFQQPKK